MSGRPTLAEIEQSLCDACAGMCSLPRDVIRPSSSLSTDLAPHGLDVIELAMWIEETFPSVSRNADLSDAAILLRGDVTLAEIAHWIDRALA